MLSRRRTLLGLLAVLPRSRVTAENRDRIDEDGRVHYAAYGERNRLDEIVGRLR